MHLYVHVPFCARRCSYCDFAIAVRRTVPVEQYLRGVRREVEIRGLGGDTLDTVYLGGGTPSLLGADGVQRLVAFIHERFAVAPDAEITMEANPDDLTTSTAHAWRGAGVNRLSLGAQSFDDRVLQWMHRTHSAEQTATAVRIAREGGIANISLDLIFAIPQSLERDWARDLASAIALEPQHVSAYGLTIEPTAALGRWTSRGSVTEAPEETWAVEFKDAHDALTASGYAHYEVSNYARQGLRSRHNEAYWLDSPCLGIGPAAHGYDGQARRWNARAYAHWLARVESGVDPVEGSEDLTAGQRDAERVYVGLRTDHGLALSRDDVDQAGTWVDAGWGSIVGEGADQRFVPSVEGWLRIDALAAALTGIPSRC
jgi:oxygen-independent coproporphyrinogen-3 oxidase